MSYEPYGDDETAEFGAAQYRRSPVRRRLGVIVLSVAVGVVLIGCGTAVALMKGTDHDERPAAGASKAKDWAETLPAATSAPSQEVAAVTTTSAAPSKAPSPTKTTKKPSPKVTETVQPPAPPHTTQPGCAPSRGPNMLAKSVVRGYLETAATTQFWGTATDPDYAQIRVPKMLLFAVAEQESGWQSDIKACDGGIGLMQVMPTTQAFIKQRFAKSWDIGKPEQNVMCGANYLAWLIAYYGPKIGTYDMTDTKLLGAVISAYNWGTVGVDYANAVYPNPNYVSSVRALMQGSHAGNY